MGSEQKKSQNTMKEMMMSGGPTGKGRKFCMSARRLFVPCLVPDFTMHRQICPLCDHDEMHSSTPTMHFYTICKTISGYTYVNKCSRF
jgi:hypothetical protein